MSRMDELEKLARAATPGPWKVRREWQGDGKEVYPDRVVSIGEPSELAVVSGIYKECRTNAKLIAALSPDRVLAILEVVKAAKAVSDSAALSWTAVPDVALLRALRSALSAIGEKGQ